MEEPQGRAALRTIKNLRVRESLMMRGNGVHLLQHAALVGSSQEVVDGNSRREGECPLSLHHHLWSPFKDLREWTLPFKPNHRDEGRV